MRSQQIPAIHVVQPAQTVIRELHARAADFDSRISPEEISWTLQFLKAFGYLNGKKVEDLEFKDFASAIKTYQGFVGLDGTGLLDQRTANAMQAPRCGVCDVGALKVQMEITGGDPMPANRQAKWYKPQIGYFVESYVSGIPQSVQDDIIATSYGHWTKVCGLKIVRVKDMSKADIVISTGRGPRNQFDGPGNTLAWAYLPPGDDRQLLLMYDLDESWAAQITGSPREVLMENVTTHEGGHTLGLEHSTLQTALMAPYYAVNVNAPRSPDDVERIVRLYGQPTAEPPVTPPVTPPATPPAGSQSFTITLTVPGPVQSMTATGFRVSRLAPIEAAFETAKETHKKAAKEKKKPKGKK